MVETKYKDEEWRDIQGYEGQYRISSKGRVFSVKRNKMLKPCDNGHGYLFVNLYMNSKPKQSKVHRLVAMAFIANPENKRQINHKDGNKRNNAMENLEWSTNSENGIHRYRVLKHTNGAVKRPVICVDTGIKYPSIADASRHTGLSANLICQVCLGHRKTTKGFHWEYA